MKNNKFLKYLAILCIVAIMSFALFVVANSHLNNAPFLLNLINIVSVITFLTGVVGCVVLVIMSAFSKKKKPEYRIPKETETFRQSDLTNNGGKVYKSVCFTRGKMSDDEIHLGTCWDDPFNHNNVTMIKKDNGWYVRFDGLCWQTGGYSELELNREYFEKNSIKNINDFLGNILTGNCEQCIHSVLGNSEAVRMIDEICSDLYCASDTNDKVYVIYRLMPPSHSGETEHGFSIVKTRTGIFLKHSTAYAKPGACTQFYDEQTNITGMIHSMEELISYIAKTYGRWILNEKIDTSYENEIFDGRR